MLQKSLRSRSLTKISKRAFSGKISTAQEALKYAHDNKCEFVDLKFTDLLGTQHHICLGTHMMEEGLFKDGVGFDGSSIRCWQQIHNSDMLMIPMPHTAMVDPFFQRKTLSLRCKIVDPTNDNADYEKCPRFTLQKCVEHVKSSGVADHVRVGPEAEFFLFDSVKYENSMQRSFFEIDSDEASWNSARDEEGGNKGYKIRGKEGYFPCAPNDKLSHVRNEMAAFMQDWGLPVEAMHHEVATAGQCEIDFRFGDLMTVADQVMDYKYIVKNVAHAYGKTATFMPKPLHGDNGSGMHQHYSLHKPDGTNLFTGDVKEGLSQDALYFIGGLMKHMPSIAAFANPITNSYRRLVPGYEAPTFIAYSSRNRSPCLRIPISHPKGRRVEVRSPDPACNPYLAFAACVQAGVDGIKNKIDPGEPTNINLYEASDAETAHIARVPSSLQESIDALKNDQDFLKAGSVFSQSLIDSYIERKEGECKELLLRPTPYEFESSFDC